MGGHFRSRVQTQSECGKNQKQIYSYPGEDQKKSPPQTASPHRQFKYCFSNFVLFTRLCLHIVLSRQLARLVRGNGIGWDGTARMAFPMNDNECQNDNEL